MHTPPSIKEQATHKKSGMFPIVANGIGRNEVRKKLQNYFKEVATTK
jgi:hypothetical protein